MSDPFDLVLSKLSNIQRRMENYVRADDAREEEERGAARAEKQRQLAQKEREQLARTESEVVDFRVRADSVLVDHGSFVTPPPVLGETAFDYRRRILPLLQNRLPVTHELYKLNIGAVRGDALAVFEGKILEAAKAYAYDSSSVAPGKLRKVERVDAHSGRHSTEFVGPSSFIKELSQPGRRVKRLIAADSKTGCALCCLVSQKRDCEIEKAAECPGGSSHHLLLGQTAV